MYYKDSSQETCGNLLHNGLRVYHEEDACRSSGGARTPVVQGTIRPTASASWKDVDPFPQRGISPS